MEHHNEFGAGGQTTTTYTFTHPPPPYSEVCSVPIGIVASYRTKSKVICCCGARTWSQVLAGIQIFGSISALIKLFTTTLYSNDTGANSYYGSSDYDSASYTPYVQFLECFIGLALGCVLLAGIHLGKPVLLVVWMVSSAIGLAVLVLLVAVFLYLLVIGGGLSALMGIFILLICCALQYFCYHVVAVHRKELIDEQNLLHNQNQVNTALQFQTIPLEK